MSDLLVMMLLGGAVGYLGYVRGWSITVTALLAFAIGFTVSAVSFIHAISQVGTLQ